MTNPPSTATLAAWFCALHPGARLDLPAEGAGALASPAARALAGAAAGALLVREHDAVIARGAGDRLAMAVGAPHDLPGLLEADLLRLVAMMASDPG
jgi:hypothetical protein